jgi:hypothetical protein
MTYTVERSEVDEAMRAIAARYDRATPAEVDAIMQAVARAHDDKGADNGWTTAWWEHRDGVDVLHLTPGPAMLDLLLPPSRLPQLRRASPPKRQGSEGGALLLAARALLRDPRLPLHCVTAFISGLRCSFRRMGGR